MELKGQLDIISMINNKLGLNFTLLVRIGSIQLIHPRLRGKHVGV